MPFSKYTADPDLMEVMRDTFHRVRDILQLSCERDDPLTEIVITKIVELAKARERDPEVLCIDVLAQLETPAKGETADAAEVASTQTYKHRRFLPRNPQFPPALT
jgi:hypothetical protein